MKIEQISLKNEGINVQLDRPTPLLDFAAYVAQSYREIIGNEEIIAKDISLDVIPEIMDLGKRVFGIHRSNNTSPQFQIWGDLSKKTTYTVLLYSAPLTQLQELYSKLEHTCKN